MVCDLGFRSYASIPLPIPKPLNFKKKAQAPKIDAELLGSIGEEDNEFAQWVRDLNIDPILQKALTAAKATVIGSSRVDFSVKNGQIEARATYTSAEEQREIERVAGAVMERFQMEALALIAQLLDYETRLVKKKNGFLLEGERHDRNSSVHKYLSVWRGEGENVEIRFEHFTSKRELDMETQKFYALAQKFGLPVSFTPGVRSGQPIPEGTEHKDFLKETE